MTYEVWRSRYRVQEGDRVKSGPRPSLRQALEAVALPEWGPDDLEKARKNLLARGYAATSTDPEGYHFSLVTLPRDFPPFRVRAELTEAHTFRRTYEVARWFTDVRCEPQDVVSQAGPGYAGALSQFVRFTGTVVDQDMTSLFGGVPIGGGNSRRDVGKKDTHQVVLKNDSLMLLFTDGGEHEPRAFTNPTEPYLRFHYLPVSWHMPDVEPDESTGLSTWSVVRRVGDLEETIGAVTERVDGYQAANADRSWFGPVRPFRDQAFEEVKKVAELG